MIYSVMETDMEMFVTTVQTIQTMIKKTLIMISKLNSTFLLIDSFHKLHNLQI